MQGYLGKGTQLPWREAGPPNHHDDKVDLNTQVVKQELSLSKTDKTDDPTLRLVLEECTFSSRQTTQSSECGTHKTVKDTFWPPRYSERPHGTYTCRTFLMIGSGQRAPGEEGLVDLGGKCACSS